VREFRSVRADMTIGECTASSVDHDNSQAVRRIRTRPA